MVYPTLPGFPQFDENHESTPLKRGHRLCIVFVCIDAHIFPEIKTPQNRRHLIGSSYFLRP
jgi:hypothetical protein